MLKASDIMKRDVISVPPDMSVMELGRFFIERKISGAPVIDADGNLIGMVTENDLISRNKRLHLPTVLRIFDAIIPLEGDDTVEKEIKKMTASVVSDICTSEVQSIDEDTTLEDMATIMTEKRVHHLPVLRGGRLIGMVGKHEIIGGMSRENPLQEP